MKKKGTIRARRRAVDRAIGERADRTPMSFGARLSKGDPDWMTDDANIVLARKALEVDQIDLDPMSSAKANKRVDAKRFFTKKQNGLVQDWIAPTILLNHAGGTTEEAWDKLMREYELRHFDKAIWVGFSVEQLCLLADPHRRCHPLDFSTVMLRKRIPFVSGRARRRGKKSSPSHGNFITGIGIIHEHFASVYGHLGRVVRGGFAI